MRTYNSRVALATPHRCVTVFMNDETGTRTDHARGPEECDRYRHGAAAEEGRRSGNRGSSAERRAAGGDRRGQKRLRGAGGGTPDHAPVHGVGHLRSRGAGRARGRTAPRSGTLRTRTRGKSQKDPGRAVITAAESADESVAQSRGSSVTGWRMT